MFTTAGGSFANLGFTTGLILPYFDRVSASFITLAEDSLRMKMIFYACGCSITRPEDLLREPEAYGSGVY